MDEIAPWRIGFSEVTTMKKRRYTALIPFLGMLVLILDAKTALSGAQKAMELCFTTVVPSLFPFFVLSNLLTGSLAGASAPGSRSLEKLLGIPAGCQGIFLTGLLGGYPTGAQAVHHAWTEERLTTADAQHLLAFCSNAGPAFLFGILGRQFPALWMVWLLWGIHILSAVAVGVITRRELSCARPARKEKTVTLTTAVKQAVMVCSWVCGWIIVFRVVMAFCQRWFLWLLPQAGQVAFYGLMELAGGCCALQNVAHIGLRFVLASGMVSFGGLCVAMQTASVTGTLGLKSYWAGKTAQCALSILLSYLTQRLLFPPESKMILPSVFLPMAVFLGCLALIFRRKKKNATSIPAVAGV